MVHTLEHCILIVLSFRITAKGSKGRAGTETLQCITISLHGDSSDLVGKVRSTLLRYLVDGNLVRTCPTDDMIDYLRSLVRVMIFHPQMRSGHYSRTYEKQGRVKQDRVLMS
jgi:hypothetical protein